MKGEKEDEEREKKKTKKGKIRIFFLSEKESNIGINSI